MVFNITQNHITLSDHQREYINKCVQDTLKKFPRFVNEPTLEVDVDVGKISEHHHKGDIFYAEVNVTIKGDLIRANDTQESVEAALDRVKDKLYRQLKDYAERLTQHE